jgi:hypothetical protein
MQSSSMGTPSRRTPPVRPRPVDVRVPEALLAPIRGVLRYLASLADADGRLVCPDHRVEHSGKNAYVLVLATELARWDPAADRDAMLAIAVRQGRRLVANLQREGDSTCFTFRPGRHDPFNCSNNVIDGGACSDALAELVQEFGAELSDDDRAAFERASVLHAQTYLRYAVIDKGIPAQNAWAMTGVAQAWRLSDHAVLELAVEEGLKRLARLQHRDGSYGYHPVPEAGPDGERSEPPGHLGSSDVSAFYQSRVTGFQLHALESLGRDAARPPYRAPILAGLEFLAALLGPDGVKVGAVEAKPWYWGAEYEVASNPFDLYALAVGARAFGRPEWAEAALRSFEVWARHQRPDGAPQDHLPGPGRRRSYQCNVFWAAHAAWGGAGAAGAHRSVGTARAGSSSAAGSRRAGSRRACAPIRVGRPDAPRGGDPRRVDSRRAPGGERPPRVPARRPLTGGGLGARRRPLCSAPPAGRRGERVSGACGPAASSSRAPVRPSRARCSSRRGWPGLMRAAASGCVGG